MRFSTGSGRGSRERAVMTSRDSQPLFGPDALIRSVRDTLSAMADFGCEGFDLSPESLARLDRIEQRLKGPETLDDIRQDMGDCKRCRLCERRGRIVFGEGDPNARLVFVGEGPGHRENLTGRPFVGDAGQLLDRIIAAIKLKREAVYICNVVKCRPPGNRNPEPDEIATCLPFLKRQLAAIQPEMICALGGVAAQTLLGTDTPISRLRGRIHAYGDIPVVPTYHPSYLLRNPEAKRPVWEDMKMLMNAMGIPLER